MKKNVIPIITIALLGVSANANAGFGWLQGVVNYASQMTGITIGSHRQQHHVFAELAAAKKRLEEAKAGNPVKKEQAAVLGRRANESVAIVIGNTNSKEGLELALNAAILNKELVSLSKDNRWFQESAGKKFGVLCGANLLAYEFVKEAAIIPSGRVANARVPKLIKHFEERSKSNTAAIEPSDLDGSWVCVKAPSRIAGLLVRLKENPTMKEFVVVPRTSTAV